MSLEKKLQLGENEALLYTVRPFVNYFSPKYIIVFLALSANAFFTFWLWSKGIEGRIFYSMVWVLGIYLWLSFYGSDRGNFWVLTSQRVFDVQKNSIFNETISYLNFFDIEDVVVEKKGVLSSVLNLGKIIIYPKDGKFTFEISKVPKPLNFQRFVLDKIKGNIRNLYIPTKDKLNELIKIIPDLSETELTVLYNKVNNQLMAIASSSEVE